MPAPATTIDFLDVVRKSRLVEESDLVAFENKYPDLPEEAIKIAEKMREEKLLTLFQAEQLLRGKYRGFVLGRFKLMDRIGLGGMGQVFLAEHGTMRKKVALKVLPPDRATNQFARERFIREARTTGQLEHPNLIKAYDLDSDGDIHFLILEYVDGMSFQDWINRSGALTAERAAYYLWQAASGLAYLASKGMVHRDIKPANLVVDRVGAVKILDLGLVREEDTNDDLTKREDVKFLGTADYLAPEQLASCSTVDIRADLYALGATGYFMLTGKTPFVGQTMAQKLVAAQTQEARAVHLVNPSVPLELSVIITKLMAKKPGDRYQTPEELLSALDPWTQSPPDPPADLEFPNRYGLTTPIPTTAVALSFNLMKAARGGSGASSSHNDLGKNTSSNISLGSKTNNHEALDTPSPISANTPAPVQVKQAITPTKVEKSLPAQTSTAEAKQSQPLKPVTARKPNGPPPIPNQKMMMKKEEVKKEEAPLVDLDALKKRAESHQNIVLTPVQTPASRGFFGWLKSLFGRS